MTYYFRIAISAPERNKRLSTDIFWYEEPIRIGVTIPLRFGSSGVGGIGYWASELSSELFEEYWQLHQHKPISITNPWCIMRV